MKLLPLLSLCLLSWSAATFGEQHEPPVKVIVMEDSDAILPCSLGSGVNIESKRFEWTKDYQKVSKEVFMYDGRKQSPEIEKFSSQVSHFPDELKNGNASIKITKTKLADSGNYTCIFPNLQPERKFNIELVVGAAKPFVTIIKSDHGALLHCEVRGASPKPQLQWQHSDGNLVPAKDPQEEKRGGSYDIILQATVTKTDTYRCVVTQKEIHHQTQAETYANVCESSQSSTERIVARGVVVLCGILLVVLVVL